LPSSEDKMKHDFVAEAVILTRFIENLSYVLSVICS